MHLAPAPDLPGPAVGAARAHQGLDLVGGPRPDGADEAVKDEHKGQHGDDPAEEEHGPGAQAPGVVGGAEQDAEAEEAAGEEGGGLAGLELEDGEAGGGRERVVEDAAREGVGEVVEGEVEEAEDFLLLVLVCR